MTVTTRQRYRADVVIVLSMFVEAPTQADAESRARRMALARQRVRPENIKNMVVIPLAAGEELSRTNLQLWQELEALRTGTSNQRQRWDSGCLPEEELLVLARNELFRPFSLCARRTRKDAAAIPHPMDAHGTPTCASTGTIPVTWETRPDPVLTDPQWTSVQRLLTASEEVRIHPWMLTSLPTCVRIELREHRGECLTCHEKVSENSALIEVDWAGRVLSREYTL